MKEFVCRDQRRFSLMPTWEQSFFNSSEPESVILSLKNTFETSEERLGEKRISLYPWIFQPLNMNVRQFYDLQLNRCIT